MRDRSHVTVVAVVLLAVVLGGALSVCVVFGPVWVVGAGSGLTAADRLKAENDVRSTLLQGFGLTSADLGGAVLLSANLTNAELRDANLIGVIADHTTTWPHGFTPPLPAV